MSHPVHGKKRFCTFSLSLPRPVPDPVRFSQHCTTRLSSPLVQFLFSSPYGKTLSNIHTVFETPCFVAEKEKEKASQDVTASGSVS